jgi:uronate dehydrogenase
VIATYNMFEAARRARVERVVYASSHHAIGFHRFPDIVDEKALPRPDSRYGVSKVFGEAVGRLYADKYGLSTICLRIGAFRKEPENVRHLSTWIGHQDMAQLVRCAIEVPDVHFLVTYGLSGNTRRRYVDSGWGLLGYVPQQNAEDWAERLLAAGSVLTGVAAEFHGGVECAREFAADAAKIG